MNWHETIEFIRTKPEYTELIRDAYFDPILINNIERFRNSFEFKETLDLLNKYAPNAKEILDIGAGNGISSINFAMNDYLVTVVEPDSSNTIGANAIRELIEKYELKSVKVFEGFAEDIKFPDSSFDVVYIRQAMHHAYDLNAFIREATRVLKPGGILLTIRDHVIFNEEDKAAFLLAHPLHKFYGGENAYTSNEYKKSFKAAGLKIIEEIKYFDNPINYFPETKDSIIDLKDVAKKNFKKSLKGKIGIFSSIPFIFNIYKFIKGFKQDNDFFERIIPGRMYSYVLRK